MSFSYMRIFLFCLGAMSFAIASNASQPKRLDKRTVSLSPSYTLLDANSIALYVQNNGMFANDPVTGMSGLYYPNRLNGLLNRNKALVYTSSLMLAAMIRDSLCAMVNAYTPDAVPGAMQAPGQPVGRNDPAFRVYKIGSSTDLYNNLDYLQWPVSQGAPVDRNKRPLLMGDQMLFCSFTDGYPYPAGHENTRTLPMGAEIHMTAWAWQDIDDIVFLQWQIINKSGKSWQQACVGFFSDCEVGQANDDLAASDSTLNLVYAYNGDDADDVYGSAVPSVGYAFVQRPLLASENDTALLAAKTIKGFRQGSARAPLHYKQGLPGARGEWGDFYVGRTYGAWQAFWRMQGVSELGHHLLNPVTGLKTDWGLSGDPVAGSGWLDLPPGHDRRYVISSGPFDWASGDTQTVAIAVVAGQGANRLQSVTSMKEMARFANEAYHSHAIVYVSNSSADPSQAQFELKIGCINPMTAVSRLGFDLAFDPAVAALSGASTTFRSRNLLLSMTEKKSGLLHIELQKNGAILDEGVGGIVTLSGSLQRTLSHPTCTFNIENVACLGVNNQPLRSVGRSGELTIERLPEAAKLQRPSTESKITSIDQLKRLTFSWTRSYDPNGDSLRYYLQVIGRPDPVYVSADTQCVLDATRFFRQDSIYRWTIAVWAGARTCASPDTFAIQVGAIQNIKQEYRIPFSEGLFPEQVAVDGRNLYWLMGENVQGNVVYRIQKYDITLPSQPRLLGEVALPVKPNWWRNWVVTSGVVYYASGDEHEGTLWSIDLRNMATAQITHSVSLLGQVVHLEILDGILCLLGPGNYIHQYQLSNPLQPAYSRRIDVPFVVDGNHAGQHGHILYLRQGSQFSFYTLGTNYAISGPTTVLFDSAVVDWCVSDQWAAIVTMSSSSPWNGADAVNLNMVDLSTPLSPQIKSKMQLPANAYSSQLICSFPFVYRVQYPLVDAFNVQNLQQPVQIGYYNPAQTPMAVQGSWLYGCDAGHMLVLRQQTFGALAGGASGKACHMYQNFPNPFNKDTMFYFDIYRETAVEIKIFDVLGHDVATLVKEKKPTGAYWAVWDGRTAGGQLCASGLYFCRITAEECCETLKLIRLH